MNISTLLQRPRRPILLDGAFGTYYRQAYHSDRPCELANLEHGAAVREIHRAYLDAGAEAIFSNTFAANSNLTQDEAQLREIIAAAMEHARAAAGAQAAVLADIGYIVSEAGDGRSAEDIAAEYRRLAELFVAAGAEDFVFETMAEFAPLLPALQYIREQKPAAFVLVSFAVAQDGYSRKGHYYKDLLDSAFAAGAVTAAGLNCVSGPGHILQLLRHYPAGGRLLSAMPNAGYPMQVNQRIVYEDNHDYYAARLAELAELGCAFIGGCCGTTPLHIAEVARRLWRPGGSAEATPRPAVVASPPAPIAPAPGGGFAAKLASGAKAVVVELNPPNHSQAEIFMAAARTAQAAGADIISITDSPLGNARADSMMLAAKLRRELQAEVLPHLCCRDRNRTGLKAALLAAAIEDIRYVLAVRGDASDEGVFALTSRELMAFISSINKEKLAPGGFLIGGALNVNAKNFAAELKRAQAKEEAGCTFFLTQPLFEARALENLAQARQNLQGRVLAGIMPVAGYKNALFLNHEVAGIHIPDDFLAALSACAPQQVRALSVSFSREMMRQAQALCDGYYFMTPLNRIEWVAELVQAVNSL